ncbi:3-keto-5-aminohexanoate cleavage protein [Halomarina salina]|uniref:3-keto-5-aminohexanoate cleavage protein n=1 Tax=Halomarina salina TaxID=1872699 RepID=A0ABD5RNY5_9EURY|nr:3-keto-5-aminohexanoate cleavage protein [Halomarina salina]
MTTVCLEAALNGPWGTDQQPNSPIRIDDCIEQGIACAEAGAAIIHLHSYDTSGTEHHDASIYTDIIDGIQQHVDAIVYPSIPLLGKPGVDGITPTERFAHQDELGEMGLLEWAVVDTGSVNFSTYDDVEQDQLGFVYQNPEAHIREGLTVSARHGARPSYAIYEPGFVRLGAALHHRYPTLTQPLYRFMFSEKFTFGYPPQPYALESYLTLLEDVAPEAPWMISGLGVDITPLIPTAVERGGHVRVGLEDAPLGSPKPNVEVVKEAREKVEASGGTLATPSEVRTNLS